MTRRIVLTGLMMCLSPLAYGEPLGLPSIGPIPQSRPHAPVDATVVTASIPARPAQTAPLTSLGDISVLKQGLDALSGGDARRARAVRDRMPANGLDRHILAWAIALSGGKDVPSVDIANAARQLPGWPGMAALRTNSERALYREKPDAKTVLAAFGQSTPQTYEGVVMLARADMALGRKSAAQRVLSPFWRTAKLDPGEEMTIIREFGSIIPRADHRYRMERMLFHNRVNSAMRVAKLAGATELANAWGAVIRNEKRAGHLLDIVPQAQRSAGYLFAVVRHMRRTDRFEQAAQVILKAPRDAASLVDPDEWWIERRALSRELVDLGDWKTAYRVASNHAAESPARIADAEFHAGWYALRGLHEPKLAARHFQRIADVADGSISLARAYYWLGRAAEAGGPGDARAYYEKAARYGTAFYGQIAASKLGRSTIAARYPEPTASDRTRFASREAVRAIERLQQAGYGWRANLLYRDLAGELTSAGELALLAVMAEKRGDEHLALRVGKIAASRGLDIGALAHPIGAIPASANVPGPRKALAYAVARQESEFNVGAVSSAGARGLLQLMPGTARQMAKQTGLPYSSNRLVTDAAYNAALGTAYLGHQLERFDGSYILTFAGYNAGPNRVQEWIGRYGDPRGKNLDAVVDWIERIPYSETRNYVQRVMENFQVYKMRLSGSFDIAGDLTRGG